MPTERESRPAVNGTAPSDLLAGGIESNCTADLALVAADAWRTLTGLLLAFPPVETARELLAGLSTPASDPVLAWWVRGVRRCVAAGVIPSPATAVDASIRAGDEPPPALRAAAAAAGWDLVAKVHLIPLAAAHSFVAIVRAGRAHEAVELAGQRLSAAAWHGELADLAELVQREAGAVLALLAEVTT